MSLISTRKHPWSKRSARAISKFFPKYKIRTISIDDIDKLVKFLDTTYTKDEADSYLSNILLKTKEYTYSCDDNVSYIRKLLGDR